MINRVKKIVLEDANSIWTKIQTNLSNMSFADCSKCVNELSHIGVRPDLRSQEFKQLITRIRTLIDSGSCFAVFDLVEGLYRLKIDSLHTEVRQVVLQGKYMKSP
jgi:hypothetical protein